MTDDRENKYTRLIKSIAHTHQQIFRLIIKHQRKERE